MKIIDPGHKYEVDGYDGGPKQVITFMKREGEGYPGNVGHYGGTNLQELLRVVIDRIKYLNNQIPCEYNESVLHNSRRSLLDLEFRAAQRHGFELEWIQLIDAYIEYMPTCSTCGHIKCVGNHHSETGTREK